MKKKGFTLIELLAVIVILAIIALIATPIIMNTIEKSKKGAAERSADNYVAAVNNKIISNLGKNKKVEDGTYAVQSDGSLCPVENKCTGGGLCECTDRNKIEVKMSGNKPTSGTVVIENSKVVDYSTTLTIGDYTVSYDTNGKITATKRTNNSYICEKTGEASKTVGAEYTCYLDMARTFYVLGENADDSTKIDLIMDRNFTDAVVPKTLAFCTKVGDYGICSKSTASAAATHIQDTFGNDVEVSFPTEDRIASANNGSTSSLPQWLSDYLYGSTHPVTNVYGYFAGINGNSSERNSVWIVTNYGLLKERGTSTNCYGYRPVITISKQQLN